MRLNRFATARDVFEAFPPASEDIDAEPDDTAPAAFVQKLAASATPEDALAFCAYLLPRREAVWWGCGCVRGLAADRAATEAEPPFRAAESWVFEPTEERRCEALRIGGESHSGLASTWLAFAAGWSGGDMLGGEGPPVPAPAHLTAKAVRASVLIALSRVPTPERPGKLRLCVDGALRLLETGG